MAGHHHSDSAGALQTDRLILRPWTSAEAVVQRELWAERDPRVPAHRRIAPAVLPPFTAGLLAIERRTDGDVIGYCGLVTNDDDSEIPDLAFELLRRAWGCGYATEAARVVLDRARASGVERVTAHVWDWNIASRRVLAKLGFTETVTETATAHGTNLVATTTLQTPRTRHS